MRTRALVIACSIGAVALPGGAARAATVSTTQTIVPPSADSSPKGPGFFPAYTQYRLAIAAAAGETNALVVQRTPGAFIVSDAVAITSGPGCESTTESTVRCATPAVVDPGSAQVRLVVGAVELGDGNDRFEGPAPDVTEDFEQHGDVDAGDGDDVVLGASKARGGAGADRLQAPIVDGGPGDDQILAREANGGDGRDVLTPDRSDRAVKLRGGPGDDVLTGGSFSASAAFSGDVLEGGPGDDRLDGGTGLDTLLPGPGADVIAGGDGVDTVSFAYASAPVRVDLAAAGPIDPTGEGDLMTGVESVLGGAGDDSLLGSEGDNHLSGGAGQDRVDGREGRDLIDGGPGDDVLAGAGARDVIVGGAGGDVIDGGDGDDNLAAGVAVIDVVRRSYGGDEGDDSPDQLIGAGGSDVLRAWTADRADAGAGADRLIARGRPASLSCGTGSADKFDGTVTAPTDCERVAVLDWYLRAPLRLRGAVVNVPVPAMQFIDSPRIVVLLRVDGRIRARARDRIRSGSPRTLRLQIAPRVRRLLRRASFVRLDFILAEDTGTRQAHVQLRPPR